MTMNDDFKAMHPDWFGAAPDPWWRSLPVLRRLPCGTMDDFTWPLRSGLRRILRKGTGR